MKKFIFLSLLCFAGMGHVSAQSDSPLTVTVTGIQSLTGEIHVAVFPADKDFPNGQDFMKSLHKPVKSGEVSLSFLLPAGKYAVSVYQDLNGNQKHDKNWLGIPSEPFCFSKNYRPRVSAPKFSDCSFDLPQDGKAIQLNLLN